MECEIWQEDEKSKKYKIWKKNDKVQGIWNLTEKWEVQEKWNLKEKWQSPRDMKFERKSEIQKKGIKKKVGCEIVKKDEKSWAEHI